MATLNCPKKLNILTLEKVTLLLETLTAWADDPQITCVLLKGAGEKSFCAGGDIKEILSFVELDKHPENAEEFFINEYSLDYLIHTYPKPFIVWGSGIVMGGGMGLMSGASHRIVTETTVMAMPETTIGLFPDVGGTYFLNNIPNNLGLFVGLTGARLSAADAIYANLADYYMQSDQLDTIINLLSQANWSSNQLKNNDITSELLKSISNKFVNNSESQLQKNFATITALTNFTNTNDIYNAFIEFNENNPWIQKSINIALKGSPTSFHVIHKQVTDGNQHSLKEIFKIELNMAANMTQHPDFSAGVKALVIDKHNNPKWTPSDIKEVQETNIKDIFASPWEETTHPLANI